MVDIQISIIGGDDEILLDHGGDYILATGAMGFGIPPTEVRIEPSASDGGVFRYSRRGVRELDLPIVVFGHDRDNVEHNLRRLSAILRETPFKIRATYDTGEQWDLEGIYVGGGETQYGQDAGKTYCRWVVQVQCPQPFWVSTQSVSYTVGSGDAGRSLIPWLAEMRVSSSQAIGSINVENPGDVESYPVWTLTGPFDQATISGGEGLQTFVYDSQVAAGETVIVDTRQGTVKSISGNNLYANLGVSPKLFAIPAGTSQASVTATNTTSATSVSLSFQPRKEIVH